jgi:hypothetical protein
MAHTPGPWEARKGDVFNPDRTWGVVRVLALQECQQVDGDEAVAGSRTEIVAEVCAADNGTDEADARLFAAAPDLLAACQLALDYFNETRNGREWRDNGGEEPGVLRDAINKAEGRGR